MLEIKSTWREKIKKKKQRSRHLFLGKAALFVTSVGTNFVFRGGFSLRVTVTVTEGQRTR